MKDKAYIPRTQLIGRVRPFSHLHLGAPPGFGKTVLLRQLYRHFMRGGRGPRRGCVVDAARGFRPESLLPPSADCRWIVVIDNLGPDGFDPLGELLARIHGRAFRMRLFTAGAPLPPSPFAFHKFCGTTLEFGMADLAFTGEELRSLSPLRASGIFDLTAGWPFPASWLASLSPDLCDAALEGGIPELRAWMREKVLIPCDEKLFGLLTRLATLHRLDADTTACFGAEDVLPRLSQLRAGGWPLLQEKKSLKMHPFMRSCLLGDLERYREAEECRNETIRWYASHGDLLNAARAAFEAGRAGELVGILTRLESGIRRVFDPNLRREIGKWLDFAAGAEGDGETAASPRFLALAARYKSMVGLLPEALELARRAVAETEGAGDPEAAVRSAVLIARILRCRTSLAASDRVLAGIRPDAAGMTWTLRYEVVAELAYNRLLECDFRAALSLMEELREGAAADDHPAALWAERFLTLPLFYLGRHTEALARFRAGEKLPFRHRLMLDRHGVHLAAALSLQAQGCCEEARELLKKQLALKKLSDDPEDFWLALLMAASIELADQEPDLERGDGSLSLVKAFLERARELLPARLENPFFHSWYRGFSFFAEAFARPEAMREKLAGALREARSCSPYLQAMLLARGSMYRLLFLKESGELPEIVDALHECLAVCDRIGAETFRAFAGAILAVIYGSLQLEDTALAHMKTAFDYFARENQIGLFRTPEDTETLVRMAWERGVAPDFLRRVVERYGYRTNKWRAKLFGGFGIAPLTGDGNARPVPINRCKIRELLAFLIHRGGKPSGRREIVAALWPEIPYARAGRLFSVTLSQLRTVLKTIGMDGAFFAEGGIYRLDTSDVATDAEGLEDLKGIARMLPLIERRGEDLREEFERLRLAPLREGYLGEFASPWARTAAREPDALIARLSGGEAEGLPESA